MSLSHEQLEAIIASQSILKEAEKLVHGERDKAYGHPKDHHERVAAMWKTLFGWDVKPDDVWQAMVIVKLAREQHWPKRDNRVDIAGYAEVGDWIHREKS